MAHLPKDARTGIMIRTAEASDLGALLEIEAESFPSPWSEEMYLAELDRPGSCFLAAATKDKVIAYVCAYSVLDEAHVLKMATAPAFRRKGLGTALMAALLSEFQARGVKEVWLEARETNRPALTFYQALGFQIMGRRPKYYSDTGEDAVVMRKRI